MSILTHSERSDRQRERELFLEALDKAPEERTALLERACGQDAVLRQRIEALLKEETELGDFLEKPIVGPENERLRLDTQLGSTSPSSARGEQTGDMIDRYKIIEKIGEGGCGIVYLAEQEQPVRRQVALKVIKLGMDTKSVIARFEAERQALALMDHANIARILDAGATATGRPYFVMEWVRGVRITQYCDQEKVRLEQRLRLIISVCHAVQHAHQKGIIHRDIKPSNILIASQDGQPIPKIIDFGIAKATEQSLTHQPVVTWQQSFLGTPAYMSPEQAEMEGVDVDTRSDIYSLGVVLYELLAGAPPFDPESLRRAGWDEYRRIIRERDPESPSTHLASLSEKELETSARQRSILAGRLVHRLQGDLDSIVMKCLEKDRQQRYQTALDLAVDLQRYLDHEPILARPPNPFYRFQKQLIRHRKTYAAVGMVAAALVLGTGISTWQAIRAKRAERQAVEAQLKETQLRRQAEGQKATAQLNAYVANINLAHKAISDGNLGRSIHLLNKLQTNPGEPDLRGFEWRYLWRLTHGDDHVAFPNQEGSVEALALSPEGDLLAVSTRHQTTVWEVATRSLITRLPFGANALAFSSDGQRLVSVGAGTVRVWESRGGTEVMQKRFEGEMITLSPDGSLLAVEIGRPLAPGPRGGVRVLSATNAVELKYLPEAMRPLGFSPDGRTLATQTRTGIALWSMSAPDDPVLLQNLARGDFMNFRLVFSPDGNVVAVPHNAPSDSEKFTVGLWDAHSGRELGILPENSSPKNHVGTIRDLAFSPDGRFLATASWDYSVRLWHVAARQNLRIFQGHLNEVWAVAFTPDGESLISGGKDGSVNLWPLKQPAREDEIMGFSEPMSFSSDGRRLAVYDGANLAAIFDAHSKRLEQMFYLDPPRLNRSSTLAFSFDLKHAAFISQEGRVRFGSTESGTYSDLALDDSPVNGLAMSPDATQIITRGGREPRMKWWKLQPAPQLIRELQAERVLFSPDGKYLAAARDREIQIWETASPALPVRLTVDSPPASLAFSLDGQMLATTDNPFSVANAISLWNTTSGALLGVCSGHKQTVWSVAFSPDHKTLASASHDGTVKLWHVATQQELLSLRPQADPVRGILFSPDGRSLVVGSSRSGPDASLRFLQAPQESEAPASRRSL